MLRGGEEKVKRFYGKAQQLLLSWRKADGRKEKELYLWLQRCVPEWQSIAVTTAQGLAQLYSSFNFGTTAPRTLVLDREDSLEAPSEAEGLHRVNRVNIFNC